MMASDHKLYRKTRTGILWGHLTSLNQHVNTQKLCVLNLGAVVYLNFLCILNKLLSWNCQSLFCQRSFLCHFTKVCTLQRFLLYGMYLALHTHTHTHTHKHTRTHPQHTQIYTDAHTWTCGVKQYGSSCIAYYIWLHYNILWYCDCKKMEDEF